MSSNVHLSFEHPQAYWPWSHSSGFHMADHGIHMPNYYYYQQQQQQQQQQHLRQQQQHQHQQAVDHGGGGGYSNPSTTTYHILHHRDTINEKEHLFEKPLTPSDVGKLNRLVIPKQHAEKHFPLDGDSGEKGLLLSFEDETGKAWRFRYSYWTSSQSYVLTKGWSRFVKEKRLDAGDVVLFQRRRSDADHLYIGCKRRGDPAGAPTTNGAGAGTPSSTTPWTAATQVLYGTPQQAAAVGPSYMCIDHNSGSSNVAHQHRGRDAAAPYQSQSTGTGPIASSTTTTTNSKRLRLFGVNLDLECSMESSESSSPSAETLQLELQGQFSHGSQRELQFLLPCIDGPSSYL